MRSVQFYWNVSLSFVVLQGGIGNASRARRTGTTHRWAKGDAAVGGGALSRGGGEGMVNGSPQPHSATVVTAQLEVDCLSESNGISLY